MRKLGRGVIVGAVLATACGGGGRNVDTAASAPGAQPAPAAGASAQAGGAGAAGGAAAGAAAAKPATGKTHEVKMVGDANGYKYDPATLTIKSGDGIEPLIIVGAVGLQMTTGE